MSYESYETPICNFVMWYYDTEYTSVVPEKILPILEEHGFYPPKTMYAMKNFIENGRLKTRRIYPGTKDMTSQVAKDFFINCYSEKEIMGITLTDVEKMKKRNENFWWIDWNFTFFKSPTILEYEPTYIPENVFSISTTYDRLENKENLKNFFATVKKTIQVINPFYACVEDSATFVESLDKTKETTFTPKYLQSIFWGNYFGEKLCRDLGMDKLKNLPVQNKEVLGKGFFFTLTNDILDSKDNPDFKQRKKIYKYLNPSPLNHMAF